MTMDTSDNSLIDNVVDDVLCSMKEQCMFDTDVEHDVRRILSWLARQRVDVKTQRMKDSFNDMTRDVWIVPSIVKYIDDTMTKLTALCIIGPDTEQWVRSCLVKMITKIDQDNGNTSNSMEVSEPRQYAAVYTRKTSGLASIDIKSVSRERIVAPSLEELKGMLEILALNEKGFSVISVERTK